MEHNRVKIVVFIYAISKFLKKYISYAYKDLRAGAGHLPGSFIPTPGIFFKEMLIPGG